MTTGISKLRLRPLLESHSPVSLALTLDQPVVAVKDDIGRKVFRTGLVNRIKFMSHRGVAESKAGRMQNEQSAGLQASTEIRDDLVEGLEIQQRIAAPGRGGGQISIHQDREAKYRIVERLRLACGRRRDFERHVRAFAVARVAPASGDVAWIDIDALDERQGEIPSQSENFLASRAAERKKAHVSPPRETLGRESEQPRIAILSREIVRLEFARRRLTKAPAHAVPNRPDRMMSFMREVSKSDRGKHDVTTSIVGFFT